jgi:hypothetical protein
LINEGLENETPEKAAIFQAFLYRLDINCHMYQTKMNRSKTEECASHSILPGRHSFPCFNIIANTIPASCSLNITLPCLTTNICKLFIAAMVLG